MAPKSKQAARRATRRAGSAALDSGYEINLFNQLPPEARRAVTDVAGVIARTYDISIETAMAMANRIRREQRGLFDDILSGHEQDAANFNAFFEDLPPHIQAEIRPVAADNLFGGLSMQRAMEEAVRTVLERHPDFVDQDLRARGYAGSYIDETGAHQPIFQDPRPAAPGFEPFSGTGRRLDDDLNSLD